MMMMTMKIHRLSQQLLPRTLARRPLLQQQRRRMPRKFDIVVVDAVQRLHSSSPVHIHLDSLASFISF
jgi:hypothetical protein